MKFVNILKNSWRDLTNRNIFLKTQSNSSRSYFCKTNVRERWIIAKKDTWIWMDESEIHGNVREIWVAAWPTIISKGTIYSFAIIITKMFLKSVGKRLDFEWSILHMKISPNSFSISLLCTSIFTYFLAYGSCKFDISNESWRLKKKKISPNSVKIFQIK